MDDFITRKVIKKTGNQLCLTFTSDETKAYKLKKGQLILITIKEVTK